MAYTVYTTYQRDLDVGYLATYLATKKENIFKVVDIILKEYDKVRRGILPARKISLVKNRMVGQLAISLEESYQKAKFYGSQVLWRRKVYTPEEIFDKILKIDPRNVEHLSEQIFENNKLVLSILGNISNKEIEKLKKMLYVF